MRNESPVGLATVLGLLPAAIAGVTFIALMVMNGGDVTAAQELTLSIITSLSLVAAAALRQWRAIKGPPPTE